MEILKNALKSNWARYLWSSVITFFAGFSMAVLPQLDSLTIENFDKATIVGLVFVGVRAGVKLVIELFLAWYNSGKK